jgi:ankyrin repeat protein
VSVIFDCNQLFLRGPCLHTLLGASRSGDVAQVKALIDVGANVKAQTEYGYPGLHIAASGPKRLELVQFLLSQGADVYSLTADRETLLHVACVAGGPDVAEFLLQDPDFDYQSRRCDGCTAEMLLHRGGMA